MGTVWLLALLTLGGTSTLMVAGTSAGPATSHVAGLFIPKPAPAHLPHGIRLSEMDGDSISYSANWAGYAQSAVKGTFTSVTDTWDVPTVTTERGSQYSSDWVGIDGFTDRQLVQAGTNADNVNGVAEYSAWTEILPAASVPLPMTIAPGDSITTVVKEIAANTWLMQVTDNTSQVNRVGRFRTWLRARTSRPSTSRPQFVTRGAR